MTLDPSETILLRDLLGNWKQTLQCFEMIHLISKCYEFIINIQFNNNQVWLTHMYNIYIQYQRKNRNIVLIDQAIQIESIETVLWAAHTSTQPLNQQNKRRKEVRKDGSCHRSRRTKNKWLTIAPSSYRLSTSTFHLQLRNVDQYVEILLL